MKIVLDLAQIERKEKELEEELSKLRSLKKFAQKFGLPDGQTTVSKAVAETQVRTAISALKDQEFNSQTIEKALSEGENKLGRSSIFEVLSDLKEKGEIQIVRPGAGRRPAQYKTTDNFGPF